MTGGKSAKGGYSLAQRQLVLDILADAPRRQALDAYQVANISSGQLSPMDVGRIFMELHREGSVVTDDPLGTVNDLAARFTPALRKAA